MTPSSRVVAILPMPADRHLLKESLGESGLSVRHCESFRDWQSEIARDAAVGVLAAEALTSKEVASLYGGTGSVPVILLVSPNASGEDKSVHGVILLERPVSQRM